MSYVPPRCINCGHLESEHIVEDDNAYCVGEVQDSTQLPNTFGRLHCTCKEFK